MATETKQRPVTFIAGKYPNLRLVKDPEVWLKTPQGQIYEKTSASDVHFGEGGNEPHYFKTEDPSIIEWMREHPQNGVRFIEEGADEPKPLISEQITALQGAAEKGDWAEIQRVTELEEETHKRAQVLDTAKAITAALTASEENATSE